MIYTQLNSLYCFKSCQIPGGHVGTELLMLYVEHMIFLAILHDISETNDHLKAVEARGFLHYVTKFCLLYP